MSRYQFSPQERSVLEGLQQAFAVYQFVDMRVATLVLSDGFCRLFGYDDRALAYADMDQDMYKDTHPDDAARIANAAYRFATEGGEYEVIYRTKTKDSSGYRIIHAAGRHVYTESGVRLAQVWYTDEGLYAEGSVTDDSALNRSLSGALRESSVRKASRYDYLTGLPTMTYFFELADAEKTAILRRGGAPALLYLDFSGMKFFNTKHGFAEGDRMLRAFAGILARMFSNESCCRIGADHFAVITEESGLEDRLRQLFRSCREMNNGRSLPVHAGVYRIRAEQHIHISIACDRAKMAYGALRGTYDSAFCYYTRELGEEAANRRYIVENLDRALRENWIQVYYQPIVRATTGKISDEEALSRWNDPVLGTVPPTEFVPALEDARLIHRLDLYVLERVLEKIKLQEARGLYVVPQSVNCSRADFDVCDMVEEIRKRVDAAGVSRDRITIEITESVIGSDFGFMKEQIERFRALGFPVWMDDFGSGYSSLIFLQSIEFDLIKFDMSFMKKLDENRRGRLILAELMRMAGKLGVDTVCEGVETEEQLRFLQEIGCSKLQGYYYDKPRTMESLIEWQTREGRDKFENPAESSYYETVGCMNLYDLSGAAGDESAFRNTFSTLPMGIIEIQSDAARFVRSNQSYRDFVRRFFGFDLSREGSHFEKYSAGFVRHVAETCRETGKWSFFDDKMSDGSVVHSYARRIGTNPVNGNVAIAVAVLSVSAPDESETYADIARALASDYYNIYAVDLDTERFIEYSSPVGGEELAVERHGTGFFRAVRRDTMTRVYAADREQFLAVFTKENILRELDRQGVFTTVYRLVDTGRPLYASMKLTRMQPGGNRIILGVSIIDSQMKQAEADARVRRERLTLGRIAALSGNYIAIYSVDPATLHYVEYSASADFEDYGLAKEGDDFFNRTLAEAPGTVDAEYLPMFLRAFSEDAVMREIRRSGLYSLNYRLVLGGGPVPVSLRAALVRESDGEKLIVGINRMDAGAPARSGGAAETRKEDGA